MPEPAANASATLCPACHKVLRVGARFCAACGHAPGDAGAAVSVYESPERPSRRAQLALHWSELEQVGWLFGALLFSSLVLGLASHFWRSPWGEVIASGVDALLTLGFVIFRWRELRPLLTSIRLDRRGALLVAAVGLVFIVTAHAYFALLERAGVPMLRYSDSYAKAGWPVWTMFVLVSVMPGIFEELAFRGVIQAGLERVLEAREAWLIQAALFSVLHLSPIIFPSHFVMGLCFGWVRRRSSSLYPGMLLHATWNALVLAQELYG